MPQAGFVTPFRLVLFSVVPARIQAAVAAGVDDVLVDWEHIGKRARQRDADTQINADTEEDLRRVRACTTAPVLCRLNPVGEGTAAEVERAIAAGANELLLPMVRTVEEVERTLDLVQSRCAVGILVETVDAVRIAPALGRLPLSRVYLGLMDLQIERRARCLFEPLVDGTLSTLRRCFDAPFGFGGLTRPDAGAPIPCRLLIGEMARLGCSFSFLRRSFHRDVAGRDLRVDLAQIRSALVEAERRSGDQVRRDRDDLVRAVEAWSHARGAP